MMEKLVVSQGLFYEGNTNDLRAIHPIPVVSHVSCEFIAPPEAVAFREDSFDPVTRIRRGRFYVKSSDISRWHIGRVDSGSFNPYHIGKQNGMADKMWTPDASYDAWQPNLRPEGIVRIGDSGFETAWRVVGSEKISIGHVLVTLRAVSLVGVLPDLIEVILDKDGAKADTGPVHDALESLVDAFHKQQPTPIVDVARETAKVILTTWIGPHAQGKDLGDVIKEIPKSKNVACWAASVVNRLHPRGKSSERESKEEKGSPLRPLTTEDAETSVHLVGMLLREIGWSAP